MLQNEAQEEQEQDKRRLRECENFVVVSVM